METIKVAITGETPILMHNGRLSNPLDDYAKALKALTAKRGKSDADYMEIMRAEWDGGLYIDVDGPYVPCENLDAALKSAAKAQKLGKKFGSSVVVVEDRAQLVYKGPRDRQGLWEAGFRHVCGVKVGTARVQRCRPIFTEWACEFTIAFDAQDVNRRQVEQALNEAGRISGLFDRRPEKGGRFGKFSTQVL
jgi:hypothetical protein